MSDLPRAVPAAHAAPPAAVIAGAPVGEQVLARIAAGIAEGEDLRTLLGRCLAAVVALAGAEAGAVRLVSEDGTRLQLVGDFGLPEDVHRCEASVDVHCGSCGRAVDDARTVWSVDLRACTTRARGIWFGDVCRQLLAVPLQHRGQVFGVYNLYFATAAGLSEPVRSLLRAVGDLLGLALHTARLEAEALRRSVQQERREMAAEVHDSVAQTLSFVQMRLPLLEDACDAQDGARLRRYIGELRDAVGEAHANLRQVISDYRTQVGPRGLLYAIDTLAARFQERTGIELSQVKPKTAPSLSTDAESEVFHIVQEALANIERHSHAHRASLAFATLAGGSLAIEIDDDGVGLPPGGTAGAHFGLQIMRERAQRLGGSLDVLPRPGGGTRVRLQCPAGAAR